MQLWIENRPTYFRTRGPKVGNIENCLQVIWFYITGKVFVVYFKNNNFEDPNPLSTDKGTPDVKI